MSTVIDFRNGRYQGQVKNKLPDGVGIFFSIDLTFIIGQWKEGRIFGKAIIIYSNGTIFCGNVDNDKPIGICYYELQKQAIKVFFNGNLQSNNKYAVIIPNFQTILELDRSDQKLIAKHIYNKNNIEANQQQIQKIIQQKIENENEQQYEGVFRYFQFNFSIPHDDLFELLTLNSNGIQYWMGFKHEGLGIKIRPLQIHEHNGRTYRICQMGVMTKDNVLNGIGIRTSSSTFNKIKIEEGVFSLPSTLIQYQYDDEIIEGLQKKSQFIQKRKKDQNREKKRPTKCLLTFINYLKRSMSFQNNYLYLNAPAQFKSQIQKISEITFTQMKIQKAHQIIESPLSDSGVMQQIEKKRRKKSNQNSKYKLNKYESNQQPYIYNSNGNNKVYMNNSQLDLMVLKEDLQRSIQKKKSTKSIIKIDQNKKINKKITQFDQIIQKPSKDKSNSRRKNGSITPTKKTNSKPLQETKVGIVKKQNLNYFSPVKIQKSKNIEVQKKQKPAQPIKKYPSPILKHPRAEIQSPPKRKAIFKQKQLQDWQKNLKQQRNIKIEKTISSPLKKYGDLYKQKQSSPGKKINRRILTQNIFQ